MHRDAGQGRSFFFFSSRRRHTRFDCDWSSDVCSSDLGAELRRTGGEYGLGRLIADAQRNVAKSDVALVNNGGIPTHVAAGLATYGDLYRVEPLQKRLMRLPVSGKALKQALEHAPTGDGPENRR